MTKGNITPSEVDDVEEELSSEQSKARARLRKLILQRGITPITVDQLRYEPHLAGKNLIISFVTFAELQPWAIASNWGPSKQRKLAEYLSTVLVLHSNDDLCVRWAKITEDGKPRGRQIQPGDAWIAATALLHDVPQITHNRRDFDGVPGLTVVSETSG